MLTKKLIVCLSAAMTIFSACRKDAVIPPAPAPTPRLVTKVSSSATIATDLYYDGNYRLKGFGNNYYNYTFNYTNTDFTGIFSQNNYNYADWKNGKLDAAGRLLEADVIYKPQNFPQTIDKAVFTYNAEGYLIRRKQTDPTNKVYQEDFIYTNGNLTSLVTTVDNQPNYRIEFTYYDSLPNKLNLDISRHWMGFYSDGFSGKRNKNLLKTEINYNALNV